MRSGGAGPRLLGPLSAPFLAAAGVIAGSLALGVGAFGADARRLAFLRLPFALAGVAGLLVARLILALRGRRAGAFGRGFARAGLALAVLGVSAPAPLGRLGAGLAAVRLRLLRLACALGLRPLAGLRFLLGTGSWLARLLLLARLGLASGLVARLGLARGLIARLGLASGLVARLGLASGLVARLGLASGLVARLRLARGLVARLGLLRLRLLRLRLRLGLIAGLLGLLLLGALASVGLLLRLLLVGRLLGLLLRLGLLALLLLLFSLVLEDSLEGLAGIAPGRDALRLLGRLSLLSLLGTLLLLPGLAGLGFTLALPAGIALLLGGLFGRPLALVLRLCLVRVLTVFRLLLGGLFGALLFRVLASLVLLPGLRLGPLRAGFRLGLPLVGLLGTLLGLRLLLRLPAPAGRDDDDSPPVRLGVVGHRLLVVVGLGPVADHVAGLEIQSRRIEAVTGLQRPPVRGRAGAGGPEFQHGRDGQVPPLAHRPQRHPPQSEVQVLGPDLPLQRLALRQKDLVGQRVVRLDRQLHTRRKIGNDLNPVPDRAAVPAPACVGETELVRVVSGEQGVVLPHPQRELPPGRAAPGLHLQPAAPVAVQVHFRLVDVQVGRGADGDAGPLDRPDVALVLDRRVGNPRVRGVIASDAVDDDDRSDLHLDLVPPGGAVAGGQIVLGVLLRDEAVLRQVVAMAALAAGERHGDRLVDAPPVRRGVAEGHLLADVQAADLGRDGDRVAARDDRRVFLVARPDLGDRHPRRRADVGPGPDHPAGRSQRALGRDQQVQAANGQNAGQNVPQAHDVRPIDDRVDGHLGQVAGRPVLKRRIHHCRQLAAGAAQQQEIDQAVLQRRPAVFDRAGSEQRVDPVDQRRQQAHDKVPARAADQARHQQEPAPEPQSPGDQPVVQQGRRQQVDHRADGQRDQAQGHVDPLDLTPRLAELIFDKRLGLDRAPLGRGLHRRGGRYRCSA